MKTRRKEDICPNCKTSLSDNNNFCHNCGQENHSRQATIGMLISDFIGDYFTFDSKFFRSAKLLLTKPGALTNEYRQGKRASYISPIRLYLFISFVYFLIIQFTIDFSSTSNGITLNGEAINQETLIEAEKEYGSVDNFVDAEFSDVPPIVQLLFKKSMLIVKDGKNLVQYWISNMSLMALLLLPIFAWMLMQLYRKNRDYYVVHLVHVIHLQSFTYIALTLFLFVAQFEQALGVVLLFAMVCIYQYLSFKRTYNRSVGATIYKCVMAAIWYLTILIIGMLLTLAIALLIS